MTNLDTSTWTYGAEHEWADWPMDRPLPPGYKIDVKDYTIVNSTGVANDPKGKMHRFGSEINTPPTGIDGQLNCLIELQGRYPEATVNYRSNLHTHIRVPGLIDDLPMLKQVQARIHEWMPRALPIIEPLNQAVWHGAGGNYTPEQVVAGHKRRLRRMRVSHHSLLKPNRLELQMAATTVKGFMDAEAPCSRAGRPQPHLQPRLCVSLRQLLQTDTIEFRHWPGTMDPAELDNAFRWCRGFMTAALDGGEEEFNDLLSWAQGVRFPRFQPYDHWLEERYRRTAQDGSIPKDQLPANIAAVLAEKRHG